MLVTGSKDAGSGTLRFAFDNRLLHHLCLTAGATLFDTHWLLFCTVVITSYNLIPPHPFVDDIWTGGLDNYLCFEYGVSRTCYRDATCNERLI